jgi:fumarate hydratase class II
MLCAQVMGKDVTNGIGGAGGNFELNVYKPLIAHNMQQSLRLLADGMVSVETHCVRGIEAHRPRIAELLARSLIREAALVLGSVTAEEFDRWVKPGEMLRP